MNSRQVPVIWFVLSAVVYVAGLVVSLVTASQGFAVGFAVGGGLVLLNGAASAVKVVRSEFVDKRQVMVSLMGGFYLRLAVLAVCLYGVIALLKVDPVGLVTGLLVLPTGLFLMLVLIYVANRRPKEV